MSRHDPNGLRPQRPCGTGATDAKFGGLRVEGSSAGELKAGQHIMLARGKWQPSPLEGGLIFRGRFAEVSHYFIGLSNSLLFNAQP